MENNGNLWGMKCPECGNEEMFIIDCRITMSVRDKSMAPVGDYSPDFDRECYCRCPRCDHDGKVEDFCVS